MCSHIVLALESQDLINTFQFGFRSHCSTIDLLLCASHDVALALAGPWKSFFCCIICFWIFPKHLTLPHKRLLLKLMLLILEARLVASLCGFLTCWAQRVVINGIYSSLDSAFPRELSLVPIVDHLCQWHPLIYPYASLQTWDVCWELDFIQGTLADCIVTEWSFKVSSWSEWWQLQLNWANCEDINVTSKRGHLSLSYSILCNPIKWSPEVYLGVTFHSHLKWTTQCCRIAYVINLL